MNKPCLEAHCPEIAIPGGSRCRPHTREFQRYRDRWRGNACQRGYGSHWQRTRLLVIKRDGAICAKCGAMPPDVRITVDHIVPLAHGGSNELDNLRVLCLSCNSRGGSRVRRW